MPTRVPPYGPIPAEIMLVGEAPGADEVRAMEPFVGLSGQELTRMLHEVHIARFDCFITNACKYRPPDNDISHFFLTKTAAKLAGIEEVNGKYPTRELREGLGELKSEIERVKPQLIIAFGNTALWALTGEWGITKWRGSYMEYNDIPVVPTYHPAGILRQWTWRPAAMQDLRRAKDILTAGVPEPGYHFRVDCGFDETLTVLNWLLESLNSEPFRISVDLETRDGYIACIGLGWNTRSAICIPFLQMDHEPNYWSLEQEGIITSLLRKILLHPSARLIFQNGLYDLQYIARYWGIIPKNHFDTMIAQAVLFPGMPKGLDYLSSLYCEYHRYWKDESKNWDPKVGERQLWEYNCKDCCTTFEAAAVQEAALEKSELKEQFDIIMSFVEPTLCLMLRGVRWDRENCDRVEGELVAAEERIEGRLDFMVGPIELAKSKDAAEWWRSPKQQMKLFYDVYGVPQILHRKTRNPTVDDAALAVIGKKEPLVSPVVDLLAQLRSVGVFLNTFIRATVDHDGRMRCSYNPVGTETFRYNSSEDAFGYGTNLQNIPSGGGELPNVRDLFQPDVGMLIADIDLDRADLQVVVWEANDGDLKAMLHEGADIHEENAKVLHSSRDMAKRFVHGTNYGGSPRTMAINCGLTTHYADQMQKRWFSAHPGIKDWHERTEMALQTKRCVYNAFGFRRYYFDRIEGLLPEALAWVPQSTVALVTNMGLRDLHSTLAPVELLLQVHDSIVLQYPRELDKELRPKIRDAMLVEIPYDDPLTIPVGLKISDKSWGACQEAKWES